MSTERLQKKDASSASSAALAVVLDTVPRAGNTLILWGGATGSTTTPTGGGVTTWLVIKSFGVSSAADLWYGIVDTTPSATITYNLSAAARCTAKVEEWSGRLKLDTAINASATSTTIDPGTITTNQGETLYVALGVIFNTISTGPTDGFTDETTVVSASFSMGAGTKFQDVRGTAHPTWTCTSSAWEAAVASMMVVAPTPYVPAISRKSGPRGVRRARAYKRAQADITPTTTDTNVVPGTAALVLTAFAPQVNLVVIPAIASLTLTTFAPTVPVGVIVTPGTATLTTATFVPQANLTVIPATAALTLTTFAPVVGLTIIPATAALTLTTFAPVIRLVVTPPTATLTTATFAPQIKLAVIPPTAALTLTTFAPQIRLTVIPSTATLILTTFAPLVGQPTIVTIGAASLTTTLFAPVATVTNNTLVTPGFATLATATFAPTVKIFLPDVVLPVSDDTDPRLRPFYFPDNWPRNTTLRRRR